MSHRRTLEFRIQHSAVCYSINGFDYSIQLTTKLADYAENEVAFTFVSRKRATAPRVLSTEYRFPQSAAKHAINRRSASRMRATLDEDFYRESPPEKHSV